MRRFKCIVSYDGTNYIGWQSQRRNNSVQEQIETVMEKITKQKINIVAAGRTDAKVHAYGQTFHFDTDFYLDANKWKMALNGHLPKDIYIRSVTEVDENFHARFSVIRKRYDYCINLGEYSVFSCDYAFQCYYELDVNKMIAASKVFIGKHDFTSFCANPVNLFPNQVREIEDIIFTKENEMLRISFIGKGFLRYMVRMLTATLIEVGRNRLTKEQVEQMLKAKNKDVCRLNAKPQGLTLVSIEYATKSENLLD